MPYQTSSGKYVATEAIDVAKLPSAARTAASGSSAAQESGKHTSIRDLVLSITAGTFTTLDVTVESSPDASVDSWYEVGSFEEADGNSVQTKSFGPLGRYFRFSWVRTGGSTVTFSVGALGGELA